MTRHLLTLLLAFASISVGSRSADKWMGTPVNVTYDHRALKINGERQLLISGSIHYPRSTPGMWDDIFRRSKEAGIDVVETYIFWNLHQPIESQELFFEGNADVMTFLKLAQKHKLWVNLRIGPYVCAEWDYGGFPEWLREKPDVVFRDYNQPFMSAMSTFVRQIVDKLDSFFAPNGGPIILAQIENEYGWVEHAYGANGTRYAQWAIDFAQSLNIGVPWIMCQQDDIANAINTCNGFYCDNWISSHYSQFPNQPAFWTENWPGWFQQWGEPKPTRPVQDVAFATARWFARGGSLQNYYMWHGGTSFGRWAGGPGDITSYDYDVALDEYGYPNEPKYSHSKRLHEILHQYQDTIIGQNNIPTPITLGPNQDAYVWGSGSSSIAFVSNIDDKSEISVKFQGKTYQLPPWSTTLIDSQGNILYCTAQLERKQVETSSQWEAVPSFSANYTWYEEPTTFWKPVQSSSPIEQFTLTRDLTDYLWYSTKIQVEKSATHTLEITNTQDYFYVFIDGKLQSVNTGNSRIYVAAGNHVLQILVATLGMVNYGLHMEQYKRGILGTVKWDGRDITNNGWTMQPGLYGEDMEIFTEAGSNRVSWNSGKPTKNAAIWVRYFFDLDQVENAPYALDLGSMERGAAYVNGYNIGRYWLKDGQGDCTPCNYSGAYDPSKCRVNCGQPSQRFYHVPFDWLKSRDNLVTLFVEAGGDPSGVQLVKRQPGRVCVEVSENEDAFVECAPGSWISSIDFASFGTQTGTCGNFVESSCSATKSKSIVEKLCLGNSYCNIAATDSVFGDPCPTVAKNLKVQVTCK